MHLAREQGGHSVWSRQEALRLQRQNAAAKKAAERERKLQQIAAGKATAEQRNADLAARVAQLESILRHGLDREAAIDLNAMVRQDQFPPLDLGPYRAAAPRPVWSNYAPPEPGPIASFFGGKYRHEQRLAAAREAFGRVEREHERAEAAPRHGYANKPHATRQLCWRTRATSHGTTTASPKSLPACENGTGRVSSTTWSSRYPKPCCLRLFHTKPKWPTRRMESKPSCVSSCPWKSYRRWSPTHMSLRLEHYAKRNVQQPRRRSSTDR